jgi:hypothetical protein
MSKEITGYPIFKGLQKPLEFMGIRGKFIYYAAGTFIAAFLGYLVFNIIFGKMVGFIALGIIAGSGLATIYIKQRTGLHSKDHYRGYVHYTGIYNH